MIHIRRSLRAHILFGSRDIIGLSSIFIWHVHPSSILVFLASIDVSGVKRVSFLLVLISIVILSSTFENVTETIVRRTINPQATSWDHIGVVLKDVGCDTAKSFLWVQFSWLCTIDIVGYHLVSARVLRQVLELVVVHIISASEHCFL